MARHWTPQRFMMHRRWRIAIIAFLCLAFVLSTFFIGVHKSVALTVDGKTKTVQTWALSTDGLLREQGIDVRTHDFVTSSSGPVLANNAKVTVRRAYEATITIDGHEVGFWTYATSADQLLKLFKQNENNAVKVTVDVKNIYNKLTGGFVINADGPVTVIADHKETVAPDGKQPAAGILDSQGLTLGKDDRVSVEQNSDSTILRITRISYSTSERQVSIPFATRIIEDNTLEQGTRVVDQKGVAGVKTQYLKNTLADGEVESSEVTKEVVTQDAQDEVIRMGTKIPEPTPAPAPTPESDSSEESSDQAEQDKSEQEAQQKAEQEKAAQAQAEAQRKAQEEAAQRAAQEAAAQKQREQQAAQQAAAQQAQAQSGLWHPTVAQAKAYAQAAAAQYGWTGSNWSALEWLWNRESSWRWNAENKSSGAYGIPQSLPGNKMAAYGANWRDDASIQINWGLNYIKNRYGSPLNAQAHSKSTGWY